MANKKTATVSGHTYPIETCDIQRFLKEHPLLSTLIREDGVVFQYDGEAPSPSKDYGQLQINNKDKVKKAFF
jgi:hypothetical protein